MTSFYARARKLAFDSPSPRSSPNVSRSNSFDVHNTNESTQKPATTVRRHSNNSSTIGITTTGHQTLSPPSFTAPARTNSDLSAASADSLVSIEEETDDDVANSNTTTGVMAKSPLHHGRRRFIQGGRIMSYPIQSTNVDVGTNTNISRTTSGTSDIIKRISRTESVEVLISALEQDGGVFVEGFGQVVRTGSPGYDTNSQKNRVVTGVRRVSSGSTKGVAHVSVS